MEHLRHIAAWFPARVRIGHALLRPMTLGHLRLLEAQGSPFLTGAAAAREDVASALLTLRLPWRLARRLMSRPPLFCAAAAILAPPPRKLADLTRQVEEFVAGSLWTPPEYRAPEDSAPSPFGCATGLSIRLALRIARLPAGIMARRPPRTVWDAPLIEALWIAVADAEVNGAEYVTRAEATAMRRPGTDPATGQEVEKNWNCT